MTRPAVALAVDLEAALRTVAGHQLAGPWQVPAELVRMVIGFAAHSVETTVRDRRLVVAASGAALPAAAIEGLAAVLDGQADETRLRSLAILEDLEATALVWAVGTTPRRIRIEQRSPDCGIDLVRIDTAPAELIQSGPSSEIGVRIVLEGPTFDLTMAADWLRAACRFAEVKVTLNGDDLRRELSSGCFRARLTRPVPMTVAIGVARDAPSLWLLRHGILEGRVAVPGWPAFEAAVELAGEVRGWTSPADLRQAVSTHLPDIMTAVVGLMLRVVPRFPDATLSCRTAVMAALLTAIEKQVKLEEVRRAPIFEYEAKGRRQWISLADLDSRRDALPAVVEPSDRAVVAEGPVLRLAAAERARVAALLGVGLGGVVTTRRTLAVRLRDGLLEVVQVLRAAIGPRAIDEETLDPDELGLARSLATCLVGSSNGVSVVFVPGRGPVRRTPHSLRLPRGNGLVRACVAAVAGDRRWLYPAARALGSRAWRIDDAVRGPWLDDQA